MARGDKQELRLLARADLETSRDTGEQLALGDAWWERAQQQAQQKIKDRLTARSIWRYRQALDELHEFDRRRVQERIDAALKHLSERNYLFFMPETELVLWDWAFRDTRVSTRGVPSPYGFFMHAISNGTSRAAFALGKRYRRFRGAAGINDTAHGRTATALVFRIVGDGREIWKSQPLKETGSSEPFNVSVAGIDRLELAVDCAGPYDWGQGVWIEPMVEE
jgi:hypothetical protein